MNPFKSIANFFRKFTSPPKQPVQPIPPVNKPRPEPEELPLPEIKPNPITGTDLVQFIDNVERVFKKKLSPKQVDGFVIISREMQAQGVVDNHQKSYVFATAWHETNVARQGGPMVPIKEEGNWFYFSTKKYPPYIGRGYVQITWRENYAKFSKILGVDLVNNMDLALDPEISAKILVYGMKHGSFTGKKLSDYFNSNFADPYGARRIINGSDRKELIAEYYYKFLECYQEPRALGPEVLA